MCKWTKNKRISSRNRTLRYRLIDCVKGGRLLIKNGFRIVYFRTWSFVNNSSNLFTPTPMVILNGVCAFVCYNGYLLGTIPLGWHVVKNCYIPSKFCMKIGRAGIYHGFEPSVKICSSALCLLFGLLFASIYFDVNFTIHPILCKCREGGSI